MFAEHGCIADAVPVATFPDLDNLPIGGALSHCIGRKPILVAITVLAICTSYPALSWLSSAPSFARMLIVLLWLSFFFGMYNGAMVPLLTEIMPPLVRTAAFSVAYSLATAVFGGFTPAICTYLIARTGNRASPALWLLLTACLSLVGVLLSRMARIHLADDPPNVADNEQLLREGILADSAAAERT
jgi:nitrate/nitrite transporter NarK